MTRWWVKALRPYDEIGLLLPAHVDPSSGCRCYERGQANRAEAVRMLRSVDMPLDEIRGILESEDPEQVHSHLLIHRERPAGRLAVQERTLADLETLIQRKEGFLPYDVQATKAAPQLVAATQVHTTLSRIGDDIGAGFGLPMMAMGREGVAPSGPPPIVPRDDRR